MSGAAAVHFLAKYILKELRALLENECITEVTELAQDRMDAFKAKMITIVFSEEFTVEDLHKFREDWAKLKDLATDTFTAKAIATISSEEFAVEDLHQFRDDWAKLKDLAKRKFTEFLQRDDTDIQGDGFVANLVNWFKHLDPEIQSFITAAAKNVFQTARRALKEGLQALGADAVTALVDQLIAQSGIKEGIEAKRAELHELLVGSTGSLEDWEEFTGSFDAQDCTDLLGYNQRYLDSCWLKGM